MNRLIFIFSVIFLSLTSSHYAFGQDSQHDSQKEHDFQKSGSSVEGLEQPNFDTPAENPIDQPEAPTLSE